MKKTLGQHYLIELVGCDESRLKHAERVEQGLLQGVRASHAHIIGSHFHQFSPVGVSGIILIAESHFTIHTWPEEKYAAVDFFTCGDMIPQRAIEVFGEYFGAQEVRVEIIERGY